MTDQTTRRPGSGATRLPLPALVAEDAVAPGIPRGGLSAPIVHCVLYENGYRRPGDVPFAHALETARDASARAGVHATLAPEHRVGASFVWIDLDDPSEDDLADVAEEFGLHPLAVEDAVHAHERPKLETYGDIVFVVLKTACYDDAAESVVFGDVMLFVGKDFLISIRHRASTAITDVRTELESRPDVLRVGPSAVLYAIADRIVDDYVDAADGLAQDVDEVENDVFSGERSDRGERIYRLKREVLGFRRAVWPLTGPVDRLAHGQVRGLDARTADYFRDVRDHLLRTAEQVDALNQLLDSALNANLSGVTLRQNEDMRKITAYAAILGWMTVIAGIYGMNFDYMPELDWLFGYPFALTLMVGGAAVIFTIFRRRDWL
jgi:magnesium transporter